MTDSKGNMDAQEKKIKQQAEDINPKEDIKRFPIYAFKLQFSL